MLEAAEEYGLDAVAMLANYSQSIPKINDLNFGTSGRIMRYNKNIIKHGKLRDQNTIKTFQINREMFIPKNVH